MAHDPMHQVIHHVSEHLVREKAKGSPKAGAYGYILFGICFLPLPFIGIPLLGIGLWKLMK